MKRLKQIFALSALLVCMGGAGSVGAADAGPAKAALERDAVCTACHNESWPGKPILAYYQTKHGNKADPRTPGCRTCHGQSDEHLKSPANSPDVVFSGTYKPKSSADARNGACLACHQKDTKRLLWKGSTHQSNDVTCSNCHDIHAPSQRVLSKATQPEVCFNCHKTIRAQTLRISTHPIAAGKVACSDCHNPHGSTGTPLLVRNTVNETCYQCHAEKRGPYLWEHPPVRDDCMNCHTPHGSTTEPLLRARPPYLCQQCHGDGAPHPGNVYSGAGLPGGPIANINANPNAQSSVINPVTGARVTANNPPAQMAFRGCANCHSQLHGSNHPGGNRFLR